MPGFWQAKTKIRKSDQLFSMYIRCRDGDCVYKKKCNGNIPFKDLTNSHYYSRRYEGVRYDPFNCDASCRKCHPWVEDLSGEGPMWLAGFKLQQLGQNQMNILAMKKRSGHRHTPLDEVAACLYARQLLDSLNMAQRIFAKHLWTKLYA